MNELIAHAMNLFHFDEGDSSACGAREVLGAAITLARFRQAPILWLILPKPGIKISVLCRRQNW